LLFMQHWLTCLQDSQKLTSKTVCKEVNTIHMLTTCVFTLWKEAQWIQH
jgi:hypothetical protein